MKLEEKKRLARRKSELEDELAYMKEEIKQCYPPKIPQMKRDIASLEQKVEDIRERMQAELK